MNFREYPNVFVCNTEMLLIFMYIIAFNDFFLECSSKIGRNDANDAGICRLALAHCLFKGVLVPQPTKTNTGSVKIAENRVNAPPPKRTKNKTTN